MNIIFNILDARKLSEKKDFKKAYDRPSIELICKNLSDIFQTQTLTSPSSQNNESHLYNKQYFQGRFRSHFATEQKNVACKLKQLPKFLQR